MGSSAATNTPAHKPVVHASLPVFGNTGLAPEHTSVTQLVTYYQIILKWFISTIKLELLQADSVNQSFY